MKTTNADGQELWLLIDKNFEPVRYSRPFTRFGKRIIFYTRGEALKKQSFGMGKAVSVRKLREWAKEVETFNLNDAKIKKEILDENHKNVQRRYLQKL